MNATTCTRCGRTITSPESVARGMGPVCARRARAAAAEVAARFGAAQAAKITEAVETGAAVAIRGRRIFRIVSSNGETSYTTAAQACTCPAGIRDRMCYHRGVVMALAA